MDIIKTYYEFESRWHAQQALKAVQAGIALEPELAPDCGIYYRVCGVYENADSEKVLQIDFNGTCSALSEIAAATGAVRVTSDFQERWKRPGQSAPAKVVSIKRDAA
jgi:hypothetical protein